MTDSDQLAVLGQQVLDELAAKYDPQGSSGLALCLHPGQPVPDHVVQDGTANPLRISQWLEDQYDYPLLLKLAEKTEVSTTVAAGLTAKSAYLATVPWAQPSVPPDSDAWHRIAATIAQARKKLGGDPDTLPFGCEPADFVEPGSTAWYTFDTKVTATATTTSTGRSIDPDLWRVRLLASEAVRSLPLRAEALQQQRTLALSARRLPRAEAAAQLRRVASLKDAAAIHHRGGLASVAASSLAARTVAPAKPARSSDTSPKLRSSALRLKDLKAITPAAVAGAARFDLKATALHKTQAVTASFARQNLAYVRMADTVTLPPGTRATRTGTELHVHFKYCIVNITRRLAGVHWWHEGLIAEDDWYVPGMKAGDMIPGPPDDAHAYCLPRSLLIVRDFRCTGAWTETTKAAFSNNVSYIGPFLLGSGGLTTAASASTITNTIEMAGAQVIGALYLPMRALPPQGDGS
jgi:hypothetical protein